MGNHFWQILKALKVLVLPVGREIIDTTKFSDKLTFILEQQTSSQTQKHMRIASKRSMAAIKDRGGVNTNPDRYGFRPGRHSEVEPVPEELDVIKRMYDMFLNQKLNPTEIAIILNNEGIATRWAKTWRATHINKLINLYDSPASAKRKERLTTKELRQLGRIVRRVADCGSDKRKARAEKRAICAELNEKGVPVIDPPIWCGDRIKHHLNKPVYSGQNWNSQSRLIDSPAFSTDIQKRHPDFTPPVSKKDFETVINIFRGRSSRPGSIDLPSYARWYEKGGKNTRIGKTKYSHKKNKLLIHPISGLLRCSECSALMTPHVSSGNDFFSYKDKDGKIQSGFDVCYYHCRSHHRAPVEENQRCKDISILEQYPQDCKNPNRYSQGLPLLEALYPLLFRAYIEHVASEKLLTPSLKRERREAMQELDEIASIERTYFQKFEDGILDSEQFDMAISGKREQRSAVQGRINEIDRQLDVNELTELPITLRELSHFTKIPLELYRTLSFQVFKALILHRVPLDRWTWRKTKDGKEVKVQMFRHSLEVVMNSKHEDPEDQHFFLHELRIKRAFRLPWWRASISTSKITPKSKLTIAYFNKSILHDIHEPITFPYEDPVMQVVTLGDNEFLGRRRPADDTEWTERSDVSVRPGTPLTEPVERHRDFAPPLVFRGAIDWIRAG